MADVIDLAFSSPEGETFGLQWDEGAFGALADGGAAGWQLVGQVDWDELEAIKVLSAQLDDGRILALAAVRPVGADGHEGEAIAGVVGTADGLQGFVELRLSAQYDEQGSPVRIGLELYSEDQRQILRAAGDAIESSSELEGGIRHLRTRLDFRLDGTSGAGTYEVLARE